MKACDAEDDPAFARRVQRIGAQRRPPGPPTPEQQTQSAMAIEREIARAVAAVEKLEARGAYVALGESARWRTSALA